MLLAKLNRFGVGGIALQLSKSYFPNRMQYTIANYISSKYAKITTEVPQGSILGPLMYAIYVIDIFGVNSSVKFIFYADDTVIIVSAKSKDELLLLANQYFTLFSKWFTLNKLCFKNGKIHFVVFGLSHNDDINVSTLNFDNHIVERVKQVHYLEFVIDTHLSWKFHINSIHDKFAKGLGMLKMRYLYFPKQSFNCI